MLKKGVLVQAKVGTLNAKKRNYYSSNADILRQAEAMKTITSSSYFFLYTKEGIKVFSGLNIWLQNENSINSQNLHYQSFKSFIREFLECFVGDEKFIEDMPNDNLEEFLRDNRDFKVRNLLLLEISPKI